MKPSHKEMLKISELASEAGSPVSTIRHYINEGLIRGPRKKSRNMAYYSREDIPKISLIKKLQDEAFLPLRLIKKIFRSQPKLSFHEYSVIVEVRKKLQEDSSLLPKMVTIPLSRILKNLLLTKEDILRLEQEGVVSPEEKDGEKHFNEVDFRVIKSLSDCRAAGMSEGMGFSVEDAMPYLSMMNDLVDREAVIFAGRMTPESSAHDIAEMVRKWLPAVDEVICSLHHKYMVAKLTDIERVAKGKAD